MADSFIPSRRTSMRRIPWQRQQIALGQRSISLIMPFSQAWRFHHDYGHNNNDSCVPNQSNVRAPITLISRQLWLVSDWLSNENCCLITRWPSIFKIMITMFRHRRRLRWKSPITWSRQLPGNPPSASPESVWILMSFPLEICGFLGILYKDSCQRKTIVLMKFDWLIGRPVETQGFLLQADASGPSPRPPQLCSSDPPNPSPRPPPKFQYPFETLSVEHEEPTVAKVFPLKPKAIRRFLVRVLADCFCLLEE